MVQRGHRFSENTEVALITKDGKRVDLLIAATPRRCDVASEIVGTIVVAQDVTQTRQARTAGEIYFLFCFY
jgi:PAS domain-containing protein